MIPRRRTFFYHGQFAEVFKFLLSRQFNDGQEIKLFERKFAQYIGTKFAIAVPSARFGLELLLQANSFSPEDQIILPAYTLRDLLKIIERQRLVPKVVDIEKDSFNLDPEKIEQQITPRTKLILATHIFGLPCNLERIIEIADKYHLKVVEDCAHALGASYKAKKVGSWADAAIFSLEFTKNLNAFGGGVVTTNDERIKSFLRARVAKLQFSKKTLIRKILFCYFQHYLTITPVLNLLFFLFCFKSSSILIEKVYFYLAASNRANPNRFTGLQARLALRQLAMIDQIKSLRSDSARRLTSLLSQNCRVKLQTGDSEQGRVYHFYVIRLLQEHNLYKLRRRFFVKGIDCGIYSEVTDNCSLYADQDCPNTEGTFNTAMQLPLFNTIGEAEIRKIAQQLITL